MDLLSLILQMIKEGRLRTIATNPVAQFGIAPQIFTGATILPERTVPQNYVEEGTIRYRTVIANDGSRYSPAQIKTSGEIIGSFSALLSNSDIAAELTSRDYDALRDLVGSSQDIQAMSVVINWVDRQLNQPLLVFNEKQRWDALVDARVIRVGDNGIRENIDYPNPAGHRTALLNSWGAKDAQGRSTRDPFEDFFALQRAAAAKGMELGRAITSSKVVGILAQNTHVIARCGGVQVVNGTGYNSVVGLPQITNALAANGLPAIETYDRIFHTQEGSGRFLKEDAMVFVARTGRNELVEPKDGDPFFLYDTLGYHAVGRAAGQDDTGRVLHLDVKTNKPPRIEGESWQTALPIITDPEAVFVVSSIT